MTTAKRWTLATRLIRPDYNLACVECGNRSTYWFDHHALCDRHYPDRLAEDMFHAKVYSRAVGAWS